MRCLRQTQKTITSQSFQLHKHKNTFASLSRWKNGEQETSPELLSNFKDSCKAYEKDVFGQLVLRYSKRIFQVERNQEDPILYWFSLLQYQFELPLRFFTVESQALSEGTGKELWVETQLLLPSGTANEQSLTCGQELQHKVGRFFSEGLIPAIDKFKKDSVTWEWLVKQEGDEDETGRELEDEVITKINRSFRVFCQ